MPFPWKSNAVVGLDIGSSAVKAVELRTAKTGVRVVAYGEAAVAPAAIVDGAIVDADAVVDAIRRIFGGHRGFRSRAVCTSLSGHAVIVKTIDLPVMTASELAASIYWEAEQYIPFDIQDVNLDYQILDPDRAGAGPAGPGRMDVLLVAAKRDKIEDYAGVVAQAGRTPAIVDIAAFALLNAYEANYGRAPDTVVVLLNAGASAINITILHGGHPVFTRNISIGGIAYTDAMQQELGLSFADAERAKKGQPIEGAPATDVRAVLSAVTETVLLEIQKTFDFFRATVTADPIDRIMLSGGAARVGGFHEMLQARFRTPVEALDPFRTVTWDAGALGADQADVASTAAVAVGLALRRVGDR